MFLSIQCVQCKNSVENNISNLIYKIYSEIKFFVKIIITVIILIKCFLLFLSFFLIYSEGTKFLIFLFHQTWQDYMQEIIKFFPVFTILAMFTKTMHLVDCIFEFLFFLQTSLVRHFEETGSLWSALQWYTTLSIGLYNQCGFTNV